MKKTVLFLIFCHISFWTFSQEYISAFKDFSNYLDDTRVIDYVADQEKNIWICGSYKLLKYDGSNVITFNLPARSSGILNIKLVHNEFILIHYLDGSLINFDIKNYTFKELKTVKYLSIYYHKGFVYTLSPGYIVSIFRWNNLEKPAKKLKIGDGFNFARELPHNQIYVNDNGIFLSIPLRGIYLIKNCKYFPLITGYRINNSNINFEKFVENKGVLYYTGLSHIYRYNKSENTFDVAEKFDRYNSNRISELYQDKEYTMYCDRNCNFLKIIDKKDKIVKFDLQDIGKIIKIDDEYIISARKGLLFLKKNNAEIEALNYTELDNVVIKRKILETKKEIIFTGFPDILRFDKNNKRIKKQFLPANFPPLSEIVDTDTGYFAASEGWGLVNLSYDFRVKKVLKFGDLINDMRLYAIYYDKPTGSLYIGGSKYVYFFNISRTNYHYIQRIKFDFGEVRNIIRIGNSDKLVINSAKGAYLYDVKLKTIFPLLKNIFTSCSFADNYNKKLWIGSEKSVYIFDLKNLNNYKILNFKNIRNPVIATILQDKYRNMWISTFSALIKIKPDGSDFSIYDTKDGLKNHEFNYKSYLKLQDGRLIFGGIDGYDIITPNNSNLLPKKVIIRDYFLIGNKTIPKNFNGGTITYNYDQFYCKINFSTNNLQNKYCNFKYNINNGNWIKIKDQTNISLIGIAPGNYNIKITGIDEKKRNIQPVTLKLKVTESFYKSKEFLVFIVVVLVLSIVAIVYFVIRKNRVKEETIREISMDLHDEVGTILTKTKLMFETSDVSDEQNRLKIKDNLDQINFGLRVYIGSVKKTKKEVPELYDKCLELLIQMTEMKGIALTHELSTSQHTFVENGLYRDIKLCVYEIINNITKYANTPTLFFRFTDEKDFILISFTTQEDTRFFENKHAGSGLKNILKRTRRHQGDFKIFEKDNHINFQLTFRV